MDKLAEIANFSAPHLFRLFFSEMDITPIKYALRRKLFYAANELVGCDKKIVDIAMSSGFESHDSFSRAFKRVYGVSPNDFRKHAEKLHKFYRDNVYCISGYSAPDSLINQKKEAEFMPAQTNQAKHDVKIVTVPEIKLIGVERIAAEVSSYDAFCEAYDRVFRNAPNRKYPHSTNFTHGIPKAAPDNQKQLNYFVGIEVTSLEDIPEGAIGYSMPTQLCAVIGYEGGLDYGEIAEYFRDEWIGQSGYDLDPHKIDPRFPEEYAYKTYWPIWEYYAPKNDCEVYEERIYLPIKKIDSPYNYDNPVRKITDITFTEDVKVRLCGQSVIAMLAKLPVAEVVATSKNDGESPMYYMKNTLLYYGIKHSGKLIEINENTVLPETCILLMKAPKWDYWSLYHKGVYYDPKFGVFSTPPADAVFLSYWEVFTS